MTKMHAAMLTDVGIVRDHNEDAAHVDASHVFFVVADGMGGHAAGEVASAMAVETVREALEDARERIAAFTSEPSEEGRKALVVLLEEAVRAAHQAVFDRGTSESDKQGMGTTLDVALIAGAEAFIAHVGDSRTYLIRDGKAAQVTTDHTVAEVLVIEGKLSAEEAQMSPLRTILVNAIGVAPDVGVEMAHVQLRKGDHLLLCSDGLHDYFPGEQELADYISEREPDEALHALIELAKERGGHDNITGVLARVLDCDEAIVSSIIDGEMSDGIPAAIDRDDTLPVDIGEDVPASKKPAAGTSRLSAGDFRATQPMRIVEDDDDDAAVSPRELNARSTQRTARQIDDEFDALGDTIEQPLPPELDDDPDRSDKP